MKWGINEYNEWINCNRPKNDKVLELNISDANISSLKGIEGLTSLIILECSDNELSSLKGIEGLTSLTTLYCNNNNLTSLKGIEGLTSLTSLGCYDNKLTSLNELINLRNLRHIEYSNNPIEYIPPNIIRILNRQRKGQNIYEDSQNVHNHAIQESIKQSILNIINIKPVITNINDMILIDNILTPSTKSILIEYIDRKSTRLNSSHT